MYVETRTYHPFKDEVAPNDIKNLEGTKGTKYYEYEDGNFGLGVESSMAVQKIKLGERLDISQAQHKELLEIQKADIEATKKLNALGSTEMYPNELPTSKKKGVILDVADADSEIINKALLVE